MIWVDTDFGFDDLWALLLLRHHDVAMAGVSLVAGNAPLPQVKANALGANKAYGLAMPLYEGADRPLKRQPETAQSILGSSGMQTRGRTLPFVPADAPMPAAVSALASWLMSAKEGEARDILALGPLTNIARLVQEHPQAITHISRLVWMGGGNCQGNHTPHAEYNAFADPEAAAIVMQADLPLEIADLTLCRSVSFSEADMPDSDPLTADLLGGYFDIALRRGRQQMSIYDPVAALAVVDPGGFAASAVDMVTVTEAGERYGATEFRRNPSARGRLLVKAPADAARRCLDVLKGELCAL
nr:nucleoside hydrolase [uncultured Cohaesibacter sp.]